MPAEVEEGEKESLFYVSERGEKASVDGGGKKGPPLQIRKRDDRNTDQAPDQGGPFSAKKGKGATPFFREIKKRRPPGAIEDLSSRAHVSEGAGKGEKGQFSPVSASRSGIPLTMPVQKKKTPSLLI